MDKEQARFVLKSFRPDGADASDPDFTAALRLAMESRELGEWLASERAFDADFAQALGHVDLPEQLREDIMACLATERGDFPQAEDEADAAWIGAMATVKPPSGLRETILMAMDQTVSPVPIPFPSPPRVSIFKKLAIPLAAAAGITLAFFMTRPESTLSDSAPIASHNSLPLGVVKTSFVKTYEAPNFDLELKSKDQAALMQNLRERNLPSCENLPPGLVGAKGLGCRELVIDGKRGSLVCFITTTHGIVHLIVFRREDVSGDFPEMAGTVFEERGAWQSASWSHGDAVCLLMNSDSKGTLSTLF